MLLLNTGRRFAEEWLSFCQPTEGVTLSGTYFISRTALPTELWRDPFIWAPKGQGYMLNLSGKRTGIQLNTYAYFPYPFFRDL